MNRARIGVLLLAAVGLLPPREGRAQAPIVLLPGTHIRFALPPDARAVVAEVLVQRKDSLWVRPAETVDTVALALPSLARLDVSRGQKRSTLRGAGIGLLSGAVVGGVWGYFFFGSDCSTKPDTIPLLDDRFLVGQMGCILPRHDAVAAAVGAGLGGALGAGVGALIGHVILSDRWEPVPLTDRVKMAAWRGGQGRAYGVKFSYSIF